MSLRDPNLRTPGARKRIAIVIANPAISTTTGWPVGFWWSELTYPWLAFDEAGYEVDLSSPLGGRCEPDAMSDPNDASGYGRSDLVTQGFIHTPDLAARVRDTKRVADIDVARFAGLWRSFAVPDGNLAMGQQNFSGFETTRRVIEALGR